MSAAQDLLQDKLDTCRQQVGQGVFHGPQGSTTQVCPIDDLQILPHFDAGTMFGRITVARRSLASKQARALTNFLGATYNHNPHLSAFSVALPGRDMDDLLEGFEEQLPDKVGRRQHYGPVAADGALNIHSAKGKTSEHYNSRMVEKEDMHKTSTLYSLTSEPNRMWIDDLSGQTTPMAYTGSKFVALPALSPQPLIGHAEGVVAGSTCFGDRNPHTYVGTAAGLGQGVDEELLLRDMADEDQLLALSQEAITVADKDWQGIFQNFPRAGRPPDDDKVAAQGLGISEHEEIKKVDPGHIPSPKARTMMEKLRTRLQVLLLHPNCVWFPSCRHWGRQTGLPQGPPYYPFDALPSGNIALSSFMSLSRDLVGPVGNAITWVFGSVMGLPKPCVVRTLMLEEGTLGYLRSDVIHSGRGGERDSSLYKLFVAFSTVWRPTMYQCIVGVVVPAWGQILRVRAAVRKCGTNGCMVVPAERECLCAVCGKVEMCATHANGTCEGCTNFEDPTSPAIPVPEQMQV